MIPLLFAAALDLACPAPVVDATAGARVTRLRAELREAEHAQRMEELAVVAAKVNAKNARKAKR